MLNIIRASLYKLFRDRTFIVTAVIGVILALLMIGINSLANTLNGESLFLSAITPGANFGLTIPINLIVFTVGEFTYGTVRNKIIAGLSKTKIYLGLFITGLVFTFILAGGYAALLIGVGSAIGGFNAEAIGGSQFIICYIVYVICSYTFITALSLFFAALFRQIGGAIALVIILLVFLAYLPLIAFTIEASTSTGALDVAHWSMWVNPVFMPGFYGNNVVTILAQLMSGSAAQFFEQTTPMIAAGIVTPLMWTIIFVVGGLEIFKHSDVK